MSYDIRRRHGNRLSQDDVDSVGRELTPTMSILHCLRECAPRAQVKSQICCKFDPV